MNLVHQIAPPPGRGEKPFVDALTNAVHADGKSAVNDAPLPVGQNRSHPGDAVHLGIHHQLPDKVPVHPAHAGADHQQHLRPAPVRRFVDGGESRRVVGHDQRRAHVPPARAPIQLLHACAAGRLAVPVDQDLNARLRVHPVPQPDYLPDRDRRRVPSPFPLRLLDRPAAALQAGLQIRMAPRAANLAPAVQDLRDVAEPVRPFAQPQKQVVVLASVESAPQSPDLLQKAFPDCGHVAYVVVFPQVFRGIVRLEMRIHVVQAVLHDPVLVGIDHVRPVSRLPRFLFNGARDVPHRFRVNDVVVVAQGDVFPPGFPDGLVRVFADAAVLRPADHPDHRSAIVRSCRLRFGQNLRGLPPGAAPVVEDDLKPAEGLRLKALDHLPQHARLRVVYRNDNADQPAFRRILPLPRELRFLRFFALPVPAPEIPLADDLPAAPEGIPASVRCHVFPDPPDRVHLVSSLISLDFSMLPGLTKPIPGCILYL